MDRKVKLTVEGYKSVTFNIDNEPRTEKDLLKYPEYTEFYREIGLGAPVMAKVTINNGFLKKRVYQFVYKVKGNYMKMEEVQAILDEYKNKFTTEEYNVNARERKHTFVFSFTSNDVAYEMYRKFENISNIGVFQGEHKETHSPLVVLEVHELD